MLFLIVLNYVQDHLLPSLASSITYCIPYWDTIKQPLENIDKQAYAEFIIVYLPLIYTNFVFDCIFIMNVTGNVGDESLTKAAEAVANAASEASSNK